MTYAFKATLLFIATPLIATLLFGGGQLLANKLWGVSGQVYWFKLDYIVFASIVLGAVALAVNLLERAIAWAAKTQ